MPAGTFDLIGSDRDFIFGILGELKDGCSHKRFISGEMALRDESAPFVDSHGPGHGISFGVRQSNCERYSLNIKLCYVNGGIFLLFRGPLK